MNCCINCFNDAQIISIISTNNIMNDCDFCDSKSVKTIDCEDLTEYFSQIFDFYTPADKSDLVLHKHLAFFWPGLFNKKLQEKTVKHLVNSIGRGYENYSRELFENSVHFVNDIYIESQQELELQWEDFAKEIKENNRFFIKSKIDIETIGSYLVRLAKTYPSGQRFYRARLSDHMLDVSKLGKPPKENATSGRANPVGIPYLYVSESPLTTVYETRSSLYDKLTVGEFHLMEPLQVISLRKIDLIGPFEIQEKGFELEEFINIRPFLITLQNELSKPIRKQDAPFDYLPTQYLCEYIKFLGFDAIEYDSAMNIGGYNLAVFHDYKMTCKNTQFLDVSNIIYTVKSIL